MSNTRKIGKVRHKVNCAICGGNASREPTPLPDGRSVCRRCREEGRLLHRLPCGHQTVPGLLVISDSTEGNFQCVQCTSYSAAKFLGRRG
jgi:hypothetical protein